MKKIIKILLLASILFLIIGVVSAEATVNDFKAPNGLEPMGKYSFVDKQGHNIDFLEDNDNTHKIWFENNTETSYLVEPYKNNNSFYLYVDGSESDSSQNEAIGILEIVEKDGVKYIINSWTATDSDNDFKIAYNNLLEFNKLNNLKPLEV